MIVHIHIGISEWSNNKNLRHDLDDERDIKYSCFKRYIPQRSRAEQEHGRGRPWTMPFRCLMHVPVARSLEEKYRKCVASEFSTMDSYLEEAV